MKLDKIGGFLSEVKSEVKKVSWPTRNEAIKYTLTVFGVALVSALFLGGIDFLFTRLIKFIISAG